MLRTRTTDETVPATRCLHVLDEREASGMGKGDKRTKRGKIYRGTYGKRRLKKKGAARVKPPKRQS